MYSQYNITYEASLAIIFIYTKFFQFKKRNFQFQNFFSVILNWVIDSNFKLENKYWLFTFGKLSKIVLMVWMIKVDSFLSKAQLVIYPSVLIKQKSTKWFIEKTFFFSLWRFFSLNYELFYNKLDVNKLYFM